MRAESYLLHVYCDYCQYYVFPSHDEFSEPSKRAAHAAAREAGWKLGKHDKCERCVSGKRKAKLNEQRS